MAVERTYFAFYTSFYETGKDLPPKLQAAFYKAIIEYACIQKEPELPDRIKGYWPLIKPNLDKSIKRFNAGRMHGDSQKSSAFASASCESSALTIEKGERIKDKREKKKDKRQQTKDHSAADAAGLGDDTKPRKEADAFAALAGEDAELLSALRDFEQMRNRIKKPMTARAKRLLCAKLQKSFDPADWVAVLEQSITACWADVYELKQAEKPAQPAEKWQDLW